MSSKESKIDEMLKTVLSESQEPSADLLSRIILAIERRQRFYAIIKVSVSLAGLTVSGGLLFLAAAELSRQLAQSGMLRILSLVFSDTWLILANWQTFVLSILESLPIGPIILVASGALIALTSLKCILENLPKINLRLILNGNH